MIGTARTAVTALVVLATIVAAFGSGPAQAGEKAGVSAAVRGSVSLAPHTGETERPAKSGEDVFLGDAIRTGAASGMQLLLLDRSVFTVGEETELLVDAFVYDPATGVGRLSASFARGAFRFVSGLVSERSNDDVIVDLPVATVGVRGTAISVMDTPAGTLVILEGPGRENNAQAEPGLVTVTAGSESLTLSRPGYGVLVTPEGTIIGPFLVTAEQWAALAQALTAGTAERHNLGVGEELRHATHPLIDSDQRTAEGLEGLDIVLTAGSQQSAGRDIQPDAPFPNDPMSSPMMDDDHDDDEYGFECETC